MSVSLKRRPKHETVRQGPAAVFNWGAPLQQKTMAEIAAMEPAEWETTSARAVNRYGLPQSLGLRRVDMVGVAIEENLAVINAALAGPDAHAARMAALPFVERIAALLGTTYDHRPVGVAVGRELGTEDTSAVTR